MKPKLIFSWALFLEAFRPASSVMMLQGVLFLLFADAEQWLAWGRGSVLIGMLFWAGWAIAKTLGLGKDRDMHDAGF